MIPEYEEDDETDDGQFDMCPCGCGGIGCCVSDNGQEDDD